jgi:hypothetical protein
MKFTLRKSEYWLLGSILVLIVLFGLLAVPAANTVEGEVAKDIEKDRSRFSPANSLDIAMAMKLVTHGPPRPLAPPEPSPVTLLYPPSADDLEKLSGPQ